MLFFGPNELISTPQGGGFKLSSLFGPDKGLMGGGEAARMLHPSLALPNFAYTMGGSGDYDDDEDDKDNKDEEGLGLVGGKVIEDDLYARLLALVDPVTTTPHKKQKQKQTRKKQDHPSKKKTKKNLFSLH